MKQKYYVVWKGVTPGVYDSWEECRKQVDGFEGARYKSFATKAEADKYFSEPSHLFVSKEKSAHSASDSAIVWESLAVDAACSGNPGQMEYRGVYVATNKEIFHFGPLYGTNNIGEFLAIVHGLALLKQRGLDIPIYSDSVNAMKWIREKKCKTRLERTARTEQLFQLIDRAEKWLRDNVCSTEIMKWQTEKWGEIPADFGRK